MSEKPLVDWGVSCGRTYLSVAGYVVAMEGDPVRDMDLGAELMKMAGRKYEGNAIMLEVFGSRQNWTADLIEFVYKKANGLL